MTSQLMDIKFIEDLKKDTKSLSGFLKNESNNGRRIILLQKLGRLDKGFNKEPLMELLKDPNDQIRYLAVKNLSKLGDVGLLDSFYYISQKDASSLVRREAVSGIGRLRNNRAIPYLKKLLFDRDPKIAMQAIRGLMVFKSRVDVVDELRKLENHPNEMIREIIHQETTPRMKDYRKDHILSKDYLQNCVVLGSVLDVLPLIPDESIHLTFTSPPYYNARDYSIYQSYDSYLEFLSTVFKQVHRVTKEGRFLVLNTSPIIMPRISRQHSSKRYPIPYDIHPYLVNMGWEFIDDIIWVKPEASVKNRNAGFLQHRKPLAYKPNAVTEMLMVYRKKTDKLIDWNIHQYEEDIIEKSKVLDNYETTNIWRIDPTFDKIHSAVFPVELCDRVIRFYSMKGDLIFDPFAGSGTVGKSAIRLGRKFFMTEIDQTYFSSIKNDFTRNHLIILNQSKAYSFLNIEEFKRSIKK